MELHQGQQAVMARADRFNVVWVGRRWGKTKLSKHLAEKPGSMLLLPHGLWGKPGYLPAVAESLCSRSASRIVVDEAPWVMGLCALFLGAILPSVMDTDGDVWFLGTAFDADPYADDASDFLKFFRRGLDGEPGWFSYKGSSLENPSFPADQLAESANAMGAAVCKQEFLVGT